MAILVHLHSINNTPVCFALVADRLTMCGFLQNYIARFGHGSAKLARQAQSKEKTLKKMVDSGLTERVGADKVSDTPIIHVFTSTLSSTMFTRRFKTSTMD